MWTKSFTQSMCILFLFSSVILAATNLVDGQRRLCQDEDSGDFPEEDHHSNIFDIFKDFNIVVYSTIFILVVVIVTLIIILFKHVRSKRNESLQVQPLQ